MPGRWERKDAERKATSTRQPEPQASGPSVLQNETLPTRAGHWRAALALSTGTSDRSNTGPNSGKGLGVRTALRRAANCWAW